MSGLSKDAMLTLRKLFGDDEEFSGFVEQLGGINQEVEQRGLVHRDAGKGDTEQAADSPDPEGTTESEAPVEAEVERELVLDDAMIGTIVEQVVARLEADRQTEVQERAQTDTQLAQVLQTVQTLSKQLTAQDRRLQQLERDDEEVLTEAIMDLPPRMRERVLVTHKPSQAAGQGEQFKTAQELANSTLSSLPLPELA